MVTNKLDRVEKTLLVGVITRAFDEPTVLEHLEELALLANTAGAKVMGTVTQRRERINPAYFIGRGKAVQIISQARELGAGLIIFNDDLSPAQVKNFLTLAQDIKVIDRSALILDIFQQHAKTKEAKTQVELAQLEYLLPRLTRQWTHLERQMGGIGTRAGAGEAQIEVDRRLIRDRISRLKKELVRIDKERVTQSKRRREQFRVSLVGYTNAGKSTLMRALTGAEVYIQDQLFATLDTTIRALNLDDNHRILLSDTVGFIRKLPHHLIASFRSTLKEVLEANLVLVVLDASIPRLAEHLAIIRQVLGELSTNRYQTLLVLNKIDLIENHHHLKALRRRYPEAVLISAREQLRLNHLIDRIRAIMEKNYRIAEVILTYDQGQAWNQVYDGVEVLERTYEDRGVRLVIRGPKRRVDQILKRMENSR